MNKPSRAVFFVSDRTGITVEKLGKTLLTQFPNISFTPRTLPFINNAQKAEAAVQIIDKAAGQTGEKALVFSTLVDEEIKAVINHCDGTVIDLFSAFIAPLESELDTPSTQASGLSHGIHDDTDYLHRMNAVNYTLDNDDGMSTRHYDHADIILIGVSRCGKTPTCLYLAMQYSLHAANYPLSDEDVMTGSLPTVLQPYREKLFGLNISPERLHHIRDERRPDSQYASLAQCRKEVHAVEALFTQESVPYVDSSRMSVEEIATTIYHQIRNNG